MTYVPAVKRGMDIILSLLGLLLAAPVMVIVALVIRVRLGRPVYFRQMRPGGGGRPFLLLKFRTMTDERGRGGEILPDDKRLTRLGRYLRASSLDELPTLWNVVRGEMSLVGPRPLLMEYLDRYTPQQARRHNVRPGITGWAQINGRNALNWDERFSLDLWYVDHVSLRLDLTILWTTFWKVIMREGISADGYATMPEFKGTKR